MKAALLHGLQHLLGYVGGNAVSGSMYVDAGGELLGGEGAQALAVGLSSYCRAGRLRTTNWALRRRPTCSERRFQIPLGIVGHRQTGLPQSGTRRRCRRSARRRGQCPTLAGVDDRLAGTAAASPGAGVGPLTNAGRVGMHGVARQKEADFAPACFSVGSSACAVDCQHAGRVDGR